MKLIVGLGNPGEKYKNNRHNVGFQFIDFIAKLLNCSIVKHTKDFETIKQSNNETILLAKPLTYMNNSGKPIKKLIAEYRIPTTDLLIVHDDLDIPLGNFKIQLGTGPKLHNGIESIENHLHSKNFWRVRIGVDNRSNTGWIDGEIYTLQDFITEEKKIIHQVFKQIITRLEFSEEFRKIQLNQQTSDT